MRGGTFGKAVMLGPGVNLDDGIGTSRGGVGPVRGGTFGEIVVFGPAVKLDEGVGTSRGGGGPVEERGRGVGGSASSSSKCLRNKSSCSCNIPELLRRLWG